MISNIKNKQYSANQHIKKIAIHELITSTR